MKKSALCFALACAAAAIASPASANHQWGRIAPFGFSSGGYIAPTVRPYEVVLPYSGSPKAATVRRANKARAAR